MMQRMQDWYIILLIADQNVAKVPYSINFASTGWAMRAAFGAIAGHIREVLQLDLIPDVIENLEERLGNASESPGDQQQSHEADN